MKIPFRLSLVLGVIFVVFPSLLFAQQPTLTAAPTSGNAPLFVSFTSSETTGTIDFGDSVTSPVANIILTSGAEHYGSYHTYILAGSYTAKLLQNGSMVASTPVTVNSTSGGTSSQPSCSLSANPNPVPFGGTSNITWTSNNASGGSITGIGSVGPNNSQGVGVIPTGNGTTYTGTFTGAGGTATCSVPVVVTQNTYSYPSTGTTGAGGTVTGGTAPGGTYSPTYGTSPTTQTTQTQQTTQTTQAGGLVPCNGLDCQFCNIAQLIQNIINWAIGISVPIAMALFAYAGFMYATSGGSGENLTKAKGVFTTVGIGFLLALGGWLIINTILNVLLGGGPYQSGSWFSISCVAQDQRKITGDASAIIDVVTGVTSVTGGIFGGTAATGATANDEAARTLFGSNDIQVVSTGNCANPNISTCTSLNNLQNVALNGTLQIAQAIKQTDPNFKLTVTGGSETGHSETGTCTHTNGCKLDFAITPQLTSYIIKNGTQIAPRTSDGALQYKIGNIIFAQETAKNHWDTSFGS